MQKIKRKLVPDRFLFFKKASYCPKASGLQLDFAIFPHTLNTNCLKPFTIDSEICSIFIF